MKCKYSFERWHAQYSKQVFFGVSERCVSIIIICSVFFKRYLLFDNSFHLSKYSYQEPLKLSANAFAKATQGMLLHLTLNLFTVYSLCYLVCMYKTCTAKTNTVFSIFCLHLLWFVFSCLCKSCSWEICNSPFSFKMLLMCTDIFKHCLGLSTFTVHWLCSSHVILSCP